MKISPIALMAALLLFSPATLADLIHTVAGNGLGTVSGDGGPAIDAGLAEPQGLVVDKNGTIFVATGRAIRAVWPDGTISTIAIIPREPMDVDIGPDGNLYVASFFSNAYRVTLEGEITPLLSGIFGDAGDGGLAINASAKYLRGIAVDELGNVYLADAESNRVRRINLDGTIETFAGNGIEAHAGDFGPANQASLNVPYDVAIDHTGNIFIADLERIRKVDKEGVITSVGSGGAWFLDVDRSGSVYFGHYFGGHIYKLDGEVARAVVGVGPTGYSGDGGEAASAHINNPHRIAFDLAGNGYIADHENNRIRKVVFSNHTTHASDFDADGWSDLLWRNELTGDVTVWRTGDRDLPLEIGMMADVAWEILATGDFDGDGTSDLFWRHAVDGRNMVWPNGQISEFRRITRLADTDWKIAGIGDFNADGAEDLLWRHAGTGAGSVWLSADATKSYAITRVADPNWKVIGVADFNGDGRSDLLWRNYVYGGNRIWLSGDHTSLRRVSGLTLAWDVAGTGDFDGDGLADIVWRNGASGGAVVWPGAASSRAWIAGAAPLSMDLAAVADFNGDRKSDLLWRDRVSGTNRGWLSGQISTPLDVAPIGDVAWKVIP